MQRAARRWRNVRPSAGPAPAAFCLRKSRAEGGYSLLARSGLLVAAIGVFRQRSADVEYAQARGPARCRGSSAVVGAVIGPLSGPPSPVRHLLTRCVFAHDAPREASALVGSSGQLADRTRRPVSFRKSLPAMRRGGWPWSLSARCRTAGLSGCRHAALLLRSPWAADRVGQLRCRGACSG